VTDGHTTLFIVLGELIIDVPDNVLDLEAAWRDNRVAFDRLKEQRPDYWQALVDRAAARKAELRAAGHLTPASAKRQAPLEPAVQPVLWPV